MGKKGYTLIEIVVVLALIGLLLTTVSYFYRDARINQARAERLATNIYDVIRNAKNNMLIGRGEMSGGTLSTVDAKILSISPSGITSKYRQGSDIKVDPTSTFQTPYYDNDSNYKISSIAVSSGTLNGSWDASGALNLELTFGANGEITSATGSNITTPIRTIQITAEYADARRLVVLDRMAGGMEVVTPVQSTTSAAPLSGGVITPILTSCVSSEHMEGGTCVSNTRSCIITNASGVQTWNGSGWTICTLTSCEAGYQPSGNTCVVIPPTCTASQHIEGGVCVSNTRSCAVTNGSGSQTWNSPFASWSAICTVVSCNSGYHIDTASNSCLSNTESCTITNGVGTHTWNTANSSWGTCTVSSCNPGYTISAGSCVAVTCPANQHFNIASSVCESDNRSCTIPNGTAQETWNGSSYGPCTLMSCNSGYTQSGNTCIVSVPTCTSSQHLENGICVANVRSCAITNGAGSQNWISMIGDWGSCTVTSCNSGYEISGNSCAVAPPTCTSSQHLNTSTNQCDNNVISCTIPNGTGNQTWNGSAYGVCTLVSCNSGYVVSGNSCVLAPSNCAATTASGYSVASLTHTQTVTVTKTTTGTPANGSTVYTANASCNNGTTSVSGETSAINCNANYHNESGGCVFNTRSCSISNGAGSQTWNGTAWGTCTVTSCNSGYSQSGNSCVNSPVDGICNNSIQYSCSAGTSTNNSAGSCGGSSTWTCAGTYGGTSASCSKANAPCVINGSCGTSGNTCNNGSPTGYSAGSCNGYQTWTCTGANGGSNQSCAIANALCPVAGSCGGSANTCATGNASNYSAGSCGGSQTWNCNGTNGGASVGCSISNAACPVNGSCSTTDWQCTAGTPANGNSGTCGGNYTWQCLGANGGSTSTCTKPREACGWGTGGWGSCSASCGGGIQYRGVWCADGYGNVVPDAQCPGAKPTDRQSCNTQGCPVNGSCGSTEWQCSSGTPGNGNWGVCNGSKSWTCNGANGGTTATCTLPNPPCPACSATDYMCYAANVSNQNAGSCGGYKTWTCDGYGQTLSCSNPREACPINGACSSTAYQCNAGNAINGNPGACNGSKSWQCAGLNGGSTANCSQANHACPVCSSADWQCTAGTAYGGNMGSCGGSYTWQCGGVYGEIAYCSKPREACPINGSCSSADWQCITGTPANGNSGTCGATYTWQCLGANGGSTSNCSKPREACGWGTGGWGACSVSCGGGLQYRGVWCADGYGNGVPDAQCLTAKPTDTQACNTQACPINGVCGVGYPNCNAGYAINGATPNTCGTSNTWQCAGYYGGSTSVTCSAYNGDCGGGGGGCFIAGTQITLADGTTRSIEDIKLGDSLRTYDEKKGTFVNRPIIETKHHTATGQILFTFEYNGISVTSNDIHPFYLPLEGRYLRAGDIYHLWKAGKPISLLTEQGQIVPVSNIKKSYAFVPVYNLHIQGLYDTGNHTIDARLPNHNFIVNGIVVHNLKCGPECGL